MPKCYVQLYQLEIELERKQESILILFFIDQRIGTVIHLRNKARICRTAKIGKVWVRSPQTGRGRSETRKNGPAPADLRTQGLKQGCRGGFLNYYKLTTRRRRRSR